MPIASTHFLHHPILFTHFSQSVVSWPVVDKLIENERLDPLNGKPLEESDIIELQRGGTGYAATNDLQAKLARPQIELQ